MANPPDERQGTALVHSPTAAEGQDSKVRLTLEFSGRFNDTLEALAEELALNSRTDVLKRAVTLLTFVCEQKRQGRDLAIVDADGQTVNLISLI